MTPNREDIIRMAREVGFFDGDDEGIVDSVWVQDTEITEMLERFAALVAAAEREACAKVCDGMGHWVDPGTCADAIRARGQS